MAPPPNAIPAIGINGLHYRPADGNFYYCNCKLCSVWELNEQLDCKSMEIK